MKQWNCEQLHLLAFWQLNWTVEYDAVYIMLSSILWILDISTFLDIYLYKYIYMHKKKQQLMLLK